MKKGSKADRKPAASERDGFLAEYDFSEGVRGKYADRFAGGTNLIVLPLDLAAKFPDSASVNKALRAYLKSRREED